MIAENIAFEYYDYIPDEEVYKKCHVCRRIVLKKSAVCLWCQTDLVLLKD
jgi:hypothetical protein